MDKTKIEWCDSTWNPVTGCLHGCEYCYARSIAHRFAGFEIRCGGEDVPENKRINGKNSVWSSTHGEKIHVFSKEPMRRTREGIFQKAKYPYDFDPTFHRYRLDEFKEKNGRTIFACSMADLFGKWVPDEWIQEVFKACDAAPQHRYLFLTKDYLRASEFKFRKNWWIGKTVTCKENSRLFEGDPWNTDNAGRANHFLSIEPIHGSIPDLPYYAHEYGFKWVIIGAETGNRKDKVVPKREWIEQIVNDCRFRNVPVFMKSSLLPIWGEPLIQEFPWGD